jgi:signal transduction histidine kinase
MFDAAVRHKMLVLALTALMVCVWLVAGMVYVDEFVRPFDRIELLLMPWKALSSLPGEVSLDDRLNVMQELLDASGRVAQYALAGLILSFAALTLYLSLVYQQRQRRARENMILLLKNQEIARRNEFIRYISATIGHEFKNNLGRIKRRIDLLPGLPQDARERMDENLDKLFADIDIFKRISDEREAGLVEFKYIDVKGMLGKLAVQYADLAHIVVDECRSVPMLYAVPPLLKTVFENIIDNAVKYKKPDQPRARIEVSCSMDRDGTRQYVTVSVRDAGIGMDEQTADQCFYRGKGTGENWGQGLYYTKYVVGLHAGKVRIGKEFTAPGAGTEVIINLPFVEETNNV